jgi:hypothetical protein
MTTFNLHCCYIKFLLPRFTSQAGSGGFRTMHDLVVDHDDSDEKKDDQPQEFYAGGAEHSSGTVITGPKRTPNARDMAQTVFNAGRRQGAKVVDEEQLSGKKAPAFRGTGYRLGETPNDTVKIEDTEISTTPTDVWVLH